MSDDQSQKTPQRRAPIERIVVWWVALLLTLTLAVIITGVILVSKFKAQAREIDALKGKTAVLNELETQAETLKQQNEALKRTIEDADRDVDTPKTRPSKEEKNKPANQADDKITEKSAATKPTQSTTKPSPQLTGLAKTLGDLLETHYLLGVTLKDESVAREAMDTTILPQLDNAASAKSLELAAIVYWLLKENDRSDAMLQRAEARDSLGLDYYEMVTRHALAAGEYDDAINAARTLWERTDSSPISILLLARAHLLEYELGSAAQFAVDIPSTDGFAPCDLVGLGELYVTLEWWDDLATLVQETDAFDTEVHFAGQWKLFQAISDLNSGDVLQALRTLSILSNQNPTHYDTTLWLGIASARTNQFEQAKSLFEKAIAIDENRPEAYYQLAVVYATTDLGNRANKNARETYEKALAVQENYAYAWEGLGHQAIVDRKYIDAIENFFHSIQIYETRALPHFLVAVTAAKIRAKELATQQLVRTFQLDPSFYDKALRVQNFFDKDLFTAEELLQIFQDTQEPEPAIPPEL